MNIDIIRPKNQTEDLQNSITTNGETFNKHTHRRAEGTLEFRITEPRKIFSFKPPILIERCWMIRLINLEEYNSISKIGEANNKFEL